MKKIAIIGECMVELNGKPFGSMYQTYGGDTLNTATYLRRSAADSSQVAYVSAIGTDPLSSGMLERWSTEGIDISLVIRDANRTIGAYLIQLDDKGERTFMYWRANSPASQLLKHERFPQLSQVISETYDVVFLSGISLAILDEQDQQAMLACLAKWQRAGITIVFDSNYRAALWGTEKVQDIYTQMYNHTQLALVTFDDEALIWGDSSPEQTISRLATEHNIAQIVVKLGAEGCLVGGYAFAEPVHIATQKIADVVDTTSAGDAFNGGFLSGYLAGRSIQECCERGNILAGIVIQHKGAIIGKEFSQIEKI